uniref:Internal scaffolding protein n=1 Tax=Dulem virus 197 TaxID=3145674 RepID=A0AAU8AZB1_9VIRU
MSDLVNFRTIFNGGSSRHRQDLTRQTEDVLMEVAPYAIDTDTGEFINKSPNSKLIKNGTINIQDKIQSYRDECDLYTVLNKVAKTGDVSLLHQRVGTFADIGDLPDNFHSMTEYLAAAEKKMAGLSQEEKEAVLADSSDKLDALIEKYLAQKKAAEPASGDSVSNVSGGDK